MIRIFWFARTAKNCRTLTCSADMTSTVQRAARQVALSASLALLWNSIACGVPDSRAEQLLVSAIEHERLMSSSLLSGPRCHDLDSCKDRCDEVRPSPAALCHCDVLCSRLGDCCVDARYHCGHGLARNSSARPKCQYDPERRLKQPVLFVSSCSKLNTTAMVLGKDGVVYCSKHCAKSNDVTDTVPLEYFKGTAFFDPDKFHVRPCVPSIDNCQGTAETYNGHQLENLCAAYQGPVSSIKRKNGRRRLFKNAFCALCHGEVPDLWRCPNGAGMMYKASEHVFELFRTGSTADSIDDIPSAFSFVLNFGLDGKQRYSFLSEGHKEMIRNQKRCPEDFLWDPFAKLCRQIYCGTEFVLADSECIQKPKRVLGSDSGPLAKGSAFRHVTIMMNLRLERGLNPRAQDLEQTITHALVETFNITVNRIKNVSVDFGDAAQPSNGTEFGDDVHFSDHESDMELDDTNVTHALVTVQFEVQEPDDVLEHSVDGIIAILLNGTTSNARRLTSLELSGEVNGVHAAPVLAEDWCTANTGGVRREYWNDEFTLLPSRTEAGHVNVIGRLYVNKTGRVYLPGHFAVNVLFRVTSASKSDIGVSSVAIACDRGTGIPESCPRIDVELKDVEILENDTVVFAGGKSRFAIHCSFFELVPDNRISLCLDEIYAALGAARLYDTRFMALLSLVLSAISMAALALVLFTYAIFRSLRNLPGWNIIFLSSSLFVMHLSLLLGQRDSVKGKLCKMAAIACHYCVMHSFFWMNVLAYDLYKTFCRNTLRLGRLRDSLIPYVLYASATPIAIVGIGVALDGFDNQLSPLYGMFDRCWIVNQLSSLVLFALPIAVLMILNFIFYGAAVYAIHSVSAFRAGAAYFSTGRNSLSIYLRMATGMGLTWLFGFVAVFAQRMGKVREAFTYLFIVCNTLQGLFLFSAFVCNAKVLSLYKTLFCKVRNVGKLKLGSTRSVTSVVTVSSLHTSS